MNPLLACWLVILLLVLSPFFAVSVMFYQAGVGLKASLLWWWYIHKKMNGKKT
jgi:hypothetical protein